MDLVTIGITAYFLGIIANIMYPYLTAYLETGAKFNYRYAISRVIGALVAGAGLLIVPGFIEFLQDTANIYEYTSLYFIFVFLMTMGGGSFGRETQKFGSALFKLAE